MLTTLVTDSEALQTTQNYFNVEQRVDVLLACFQGFKNLLICDSRQLFLEGNFQLC